jgi:hypothetical protein
MDFSWLKIKFLIAIKRSILHASFGECSDLLRENFMIKFYSEKIKFKNSLKTNQT